jgi:glycosyltransferase involved in cell wall biosynthesis
MKPIRLAIVQYGGDYRSVSRSLFDAGAETYQGQRYLLRSLSAMVQEISELEQISFISCASPEAYQEEVVPGLKIIGAGMNPYNDQKAVWQLIEDQQPTHLVLQFPLTNFFKYASARGIRSMGLLADSFNMHGLRPWLSKKRLVQQLNRSEVEWVANHGLNACAGLQDLGIKAEKIIPWDLPYDSDPKTNSPKQLRVGTPGTLLYVGSVIPDKGVGDLIQALDHLKQKGIKPQLQIAGGGDLAPFQQQVADLGLESQVTFLGVVAHGRVSELMRESSIVVVPSWHQYGEGIPFTIYEAFCARTPVIGSDHPMFLGNLLHGENALLFPERDAVGLAENIERLLTDADLYGKLSEASAEAWQRLQIPVKWGDLIRRWVVSTPENADWFRAHRFISGRYQVPRDRLLVS